MRPEKLIREQASGALKPNMYSSIASNRLICCKAFLRPNCLSIFWISLLIIHDCNMHQSKNEKKRFNFFSYPKKIYHFVVSGFISITLWIFLQHTLPTPWLHYFTMAWMALPWLAMAWWHHQSRRVQPTLAASSEWELFPSSLRVLQQQVRTALSSSETAAMQAIEELTRIQRLNTAMVAEASQSLANTGELTQKMQQHSEESRQALQSFVEQQQLLAQLQGQKDAQVTAAMADITNLIGPLVDVIRNIAQQTQLLSFNAAIEAARAGNEGNGFKIVATAVRELALQTTDAAKKIEEGIASVQKAVHINSVSYSQEIAEKIEGMHAMHSLLAANMAHSHAIFPLLQELSRSMDQGTTEIRDRVVDVLGTMQFQDILRQILEQVENGLQTLSSCSESALQGQGPSVELQQLLQTWKETYVSFEQRMAHAQTVQDGDPLPTQKGPSIELF